MGRKLRAISRTIRRRSGEAKAEVLALTEQTGELLARSIREARRLAALASQLASGLQLRVRAPPARFAALCQRMLISIRMAHVRTCVR